MIEAIEKIGHLLSQQQEESIPQLTLGKVGSEQISLSRLTSSQLTTLLELMGKKEPTCDEKLKAAYLMGRISWSCCLVISAFAAHGAWIRHIEPNGLAFTPRTVYWEEGGESGEYTVFDVKIDAEAAVCSKQDAPIPLAKNIERLLAPLVDLLAAETGLGKAALWRLVADSLAIALLSVGRQKREEERIIEFGRQMLRSKSTKLFNKQTDFEWVSLPERPDIGDWMRVRGGCCRHYTLERKDADYCTTCVLRSADSRRERYQDYLRRTLAS